jgi:prepilin-type N-terminal cleavage/methylation domain-containing protein
MKTTQHPSNAFTLVELLVVMVVIGIMGSMVTVAVQGVMVSSRASRTRTIVSLIDSVIQEKYDSYKYRSLTVEIPSPSFAAQVTGNTLSFEILSREAARVRLNMIRDLQRMEMPDRYSDFQTPPASLHGAANPVMINSSGDIIGTRQTNSSRESFQMSWYTSSTLPSPVQAYQARVTTGATTAFQSAECLYLIMATTYVGGTPAIDAIPTSNIGDVDNDGMFEILDGWDNPIGFIRWPVGYFDPDGVIDVTTPDEFDLFRSDFFYSIQTPSAPSASAVVQAVDVNSGAAIAPWALRPLIISAGEDRAFGIVFDPIDDSGTVQDAYSYTNSSWAWPKDTANMGTESVGRGTVAYTWVDPYLRRFIHANDVGIIDRNNSTYASTQRRLPGEEQTGSENEVLADNITNFSLQVAQ